jgi:sensor histidine kinase YesM
MTVALPAKPAPFWAARAVYGLGLGALVAALEFAHYAPLVGERGGIGLFEIALLLPDWGGEFALLSLVVGYAEARGLSAPRFALAVVAGAFAAALVWYAVLDVVLRDLLGVGLFIDYVGQPVTWASRILYHTWMMIFFGGLAAAVEASQRRQARLLAALRAAELQRAGARQRLAELSLGALQARIDPAFVFETLSRLERLYEADATAADRLLDELIAFLRRALTDIRSAPLPAA